MLFTNATFIGIDPTAGVKPYAYAALNKDRELMALGTAPVQDVLAFVAGQQEAIVAVCAPRQPNLGLMTDEEVRKGLKPVPNPGRWVDFRVADYLLRQRNIRIPQTRSRGADSPNWMQKGFDFYRKLESFGYVLFPSENSTHQFLEVFPHASFTVLLGRVPFRKRTLEGRIQRQLILFENNLEIPDPMRIFEEITRYKLLQGIIPDDDLYQPGELDALVAAYTALVSGTLPESITSVGDYKEGQVILPVKELLESYE